jgi:hypothetical protein
VSDGPRFDRKQVVHNISIAFATLIRSYRNGLGEMIFKGNETNGVMRDAILEACRSEKIDLAEKK